MSNVDTEKKLAEDLGFGTKFAGSGWMLNPDGSFNIEKRGGNRMSWYQHFIYLPTFWFFTEIILYFILINVVFAIFYFLNGVQNINIPSATIFQDFLNCFYFSIQTFTSVGYGFLNPQNNIANLIAAINALVGLLSLALITGMIFSRFSKSKASIAHSEHMLMTPLNGVPTIQFRIVNQSTSTLINMECAVNLTWIENVNGLPRRKFSRIKLELDSIYLFPLNWTLVHKLDEKSPLCNKSLDELKAQHAEFLVMVKGFDDTYDQNIFTNFSYHAEDIIENATFELMYHSEGDKTVLYLDKLNSFEKKEG